MPDESQLSGDLARSRHPDYAKKRELWDFAFDHYDDLGVYRKLKKYLPQKKQGEHPEEYTERKSLAQYPNLLGPTLDSFTGLLFHKESDAEREWGPLGDPEDDDSLASTISEDADGEGTDHEAQLKLLSTYLLVYQRAGILVDTNKPPDVGEISREEARRQGFRPSWNLLEPQAILDWLPDSNGRVVEALIHETADTRESLADTDADAEQERFLWLDLEGWIRFVEDGDNEKGVRVVDTGTYSYTDGTGQRTLPLFIAELPMDRYPAYSLARANNAIFNGLSELRWSLRKGSFPRFIFTGDETAFKNFEDRMNRGAIAIQEHLTEDASGKGHRWVSPDMDPARTQVEVRELLVTDFWRQAMYEFSDKSVQRTATEINAEFISSIGAFLNLLAGSMDEAENATLRLLEQAAGHPGGEASVERARDFTVQDGMELAAGLKKVLFGEMGEMPMPAELQSEGVKKVARHAGILTDDNAEEIEDAIDRNAEIEADRQALFEESLDAAAEQEPPTVGEARESGEAA